MSDIMLFRGNATPELAQEIATQLNLSLGNATVGKFSDGELMLQLHENVRGRDAYIIQSTCYPTNDNLMELILCCNGKQILFVIFCSLFYPHSEILFRFPVCTIDVTTFHPSRH